MYPSQVRTAQPGLPAERQASRQMTAEAYRSQAGSGNFLHLAVPAMELQPGDNLAVNFHLKTSNNNVRNSVPFFTYLVGTAAPSAWATWACRWPPRRHFLRRS